MSAIELRERGRWTRIRDSRARKKGGNDPNRDWKSDVRVRRGGVTRRVLVDVKRGEQDGFGEIKLVDLLHRHLC